MSLNSPDLWYLRSAKNPDGLWSVAGYENHSHGDGEVVQSEAADAVPEGWAWRTFDTDRGILRVDYGSPGDGAPPLWFVNVDEPSGPKPATNLVAFATDHHEPGTIISRYAFATLGVDNNLQAGAVRWYRSGVVHQVFVTPVWRRRFVATSLVLVADAFHQANGWPGHLRSDGRRTDMGKLLAAGSRFPQRFAPLEQTMPAMDPPDASAALD